MVYTIPANVKAFAKITYDQLGFADDATYNTFLTALILEVEALIDSYVGHDFNPTSGTIRLDGSGKETLHITRAGLVGTTPPHLLPLPLRSIASLTIDGTVQNIADIQVYNTYLKYENNIFCTGRQNIVINAIWGYAAVPADIAFITTQVCANALRNILKRYLAPDILTKAVMARGGLETFYAEDAELTPHLKDRLNRYRFSDIGVG